jgi:hypothetical protein
VVAQRRRLRALDVLEPAQVLRGELSERDATAPTLLGVVLEQGLLGVVLANERQHPFGSHRLGQEALGRVAALATLTALSVRLHPGTAQSADHGLAVAGPLPVPEAAGRTLADEGP